MKPEIFYQGLHWQEYFDSMQTNRELLQRKRSDFRLPATEAERWRRSRVAHVLIFTDDWCQDSVSALPPLLAIAEIVPFELRVMRRSERIDLQRLLTGQAYPPIPMFIFYDADWEETGRFVEMPRAFRRLKSDPAEAFWLQEMYDEIWWETELEELAAVAAEQAPE